ncbi:xanthine dehydrogenase family protein molybdopterin-binding subunit [Hymenobacter sp. ASUV-10]|uniref:Xanthine dehydrogenase family protein molybdopterin-binding subunit n=1 Tax=Hymenobacter aranciens TaxID=3063996 RepID=A0ABT9BHN4_9BACT|nr:xanthine dehydrogenase family protein molybdopterin-binding subunit [Hymenobacter sp. ASUV-10]MDO7877776.1 xanthine dehydrogenase family protein molybdopterin-binding subunit [Hymenobacter sp. ASUV-10]
MMTTDYIGKPTNRVDGPAKVAGTAKYAAEFNVPNLLYGYVVSSPIAKGKITKINAEEVLALPGVHKVFSHENVPSLAWFDRSYKDDVAPGGSPFRPLHSAEVKYSQQPVALVVADTFELARYAASVLEIEYEQTAHETDLSKHIDDAREPGGGKTGYKPPKSRGNFGRGWEQGVAKVEANFQHGAQHHNPMENFATTVEWLGDKSLNVYDKTQGAFNSQQYIMKVFGLSKDQARVISKYTGGGFGSGLRPQYQLFLAVLASLELERSVRVSLTRQQMFSFGHRPHTLQHVALATNADGSLSGINHFAVAETSQFEDFTENVVGWSGMIYDCKNVKLGYRLSKLDVYTPLDMRAPGAASGSIALEIAMDEMAEAAGLDPVEFRLRNYADYDQEQNLPFSSKKLRDCYHEGATKFGWANRNPAPRSMRQGNRLIGWGMAGGIWDSATQPAQAKASLDADGHLRVQSGSNDIGTGTYTIMTQIAAETLGLPIEAVTFELGDTLMPEAPVQGGSWTASSVGTAVRKACQALGEKLLKQAQKMDESAFADATIDDVQFVNGQLRLRTDPDQAVVLRDLVQASGEPRLEAENSKLPGMLGMLKPAQYSMHAHNAVFVEVQVDEELGTIHVTRVVNAVAAGRILNPKTARSQVLGSVVWGISMALMEESVMDHRFGRYMNHNYAEYHIPVNADIHDIDVIFVHEEDDKVNELGVKGIGEVGLLGVAAAISNAVYHATGKRVRDMPVMIDKLL